MERPPYRTLNPHCNLESGRRSPSGKGGKRRLGVARGRPNEVVERLISDLGERRERVENVLRRVLPTAERLRREERRVGLDEESILWRRDRRLPQMFVLRVRDVPREREPVSAFGA